MTKTRDYEEMLKMWKSPNLMYNLATFNVLKVKPKVKTSKKKK